MTRRRRHSRLRQAQVPCRKRHDARRVDGGTTLVELLVTLFVTAIALSIVLPFVTAAGTASTATSGVTSATAAARLALQSIEVEVGSANQICLPTATAVAAPSDTCTGGGTGAAVRVDSCAFGTPQWVQWQVTGGVLEEQAWKPVSDGSVTPSAWNAVATSIVSPLPFSLSTTTPTTSTTSTTTTTSPMLPVSPTVLTVTLAVSSGRGVGSVVVPVSSSIAALDTQYGSSPVPAC